MPGNSDEYYFENLEDKFDLYMNEYDVQRREHLLFSVLLNHYSLASKCVLEVGSGTGRFSRVIHEKQADLTILDIGENLVQKVSQALNCRGVVGDACRLPFEDERFDFVISSECIEHTCDPRTAIREMCRVCKKGGCIVITSPNKLWYPVLVLSQLLKLRKFSGIERWLLPFQAKHVMQANGMIDVQLRGCHLWPFQLTMLQPLLRRLDHQSRWLYPLMINYGLLGHKTG